MPLSNVLSIAGAVRCFGCRSPGAWLCDACTEELHPPTRSEPIAGVDRVVTPWTYAGAARDLVLALKLRARRPAAGVLADGLARELWARGSPAGCITWVPGRRKDIRIRGFDHAELIASGLGARIGLPVVPMLQRSLDRPDQTTLSGTARRLNLRGAFAARAPIGRSHPQWRLDHVLLVDDLVTTGATAAACAAALMDAGIAHVELAAPCRA